MHTQFVRCATIQFDLAQSSRTEIFLVLASGKMLWRWRAQIMSPDEVRACYRLYAAYYTSCGISPYRRMLASVVQLRHVIFKESLAQIAWTELKTQK